MVRARLLARPDPFNDWRGPTRRSSVRRQAASQSAFDLFDDGGRAPPERPAVSPLSHHPKLPQADAGDVRALVSWEDGFALNPR